jgi:aspartyl-tRNA synthetase
LCKAHSCTRCESTSAEHSSLAAGKHCTPAPEQGRRARTSSLEPEQAQEKFGFLLEAFTFGAPPHGGIAFGWDRICTLLSGADSIREVIAFPKSGGGYDPLTGAPAAITPDQRKEAGVDATPQPATP